jgi:hypothetical protein
VADDFMPDDLSIDDRIVGGASAYLGQKIVLAALSEDNLILTLSNGRSIKICDDGQQCCEARYMHTDDDVQSLVGHTLTRIEAKEVAEADDDIDDAHQVVFLEVGTDNGFITIENHNVHNGCYDGFDLTIFKR